MKASSPSFRLIELTTALPCTHLSPASITDHFDESIITGTRAMSGSRGDEIQEAHHRRLRIEHPLVHVDVDHLRAADDLLARDVERGGVVAGLDQLAELRRAGDVRALADVDEQRLLVDVRAARARPGGTSTGTLGIGAARTCSAPSRISRMCSGVVPQQPPTMLTKPEARDSRAGSPRSPRRSRRIRRRRSADPALGYAQT